MPTVVRARTRRNSPVAQFAWCAFPTEMGWVALAGHDRCLSYLTVGHRSRTEAAAALGRQVSLGEAAADWWPELVDRIQNYLAGTAENFADINVAPRGNTALQRRAYTACRAIPYGRTLSYGQLAQKIGSAGAARFIGNCMAQNRVPLIVPCHRVVGSQGALGGYSGAGGLALKRRLLDLESGQ